MKRFFDFMTRSVSNFLAVDTMAQLLRDAGFKELRETDSWAGIAPGGKFYVVKNSTAIFAFVAGSDPLSGFHIIAAHSDSPGFRIKPNPEIKVGSCGNVVKLNTEVYGGAIYHTWFDRPLGLSGRVMLANHADPLHPRAVIMRTECPRLVIPHLAIHFNREVNRGVALSAQKDMLPVLGYVNRELGENTPVKQIIADATGCNPADILDFDLTLFDIQPPETVGFDSTWVNCGRLDDLAMAWCALQALINSKPGRHTHVMAIFDNEETGSGTKQGAHSPVLRNILSRITLQLHGSDDSETMARAVAASFFISADCAHAAHPNYLEKMDPVNLPVLGGGPVVKVNANCKYMTDADSSAVFKQLCRRADVPCQEFVNHSDSPGGSTLGNILTGSLDMRGVDMGIGLWAMHSVRETASLTDVELTTRVFTTFYDC
jgi:aspartyl aminopeptidase